MLSHRCKVLCAPSHIGTHRDSTAGLRPSPTCSGRGVLWQQPASAAFHGSLGPPGAQAAAPVCCPAAAAAAAACFGGPGHTAVDGQGLPPLLLLLRKGVAQAIGARIQGNMLLLLAGPARQLSLKGWRQATLLRCCSPVCLLWLCCLAPLLPPRHLCNHADDLQAARQVGRQVSRQAVAVA